MQRQCSHASLCGLTAFAAVASAPRHEQAHDPREGDHLGTELQLFPSLVPALQGPQISPNRSARVILILPLDILILIGAQGYPVARFPLPDDGDVDPFQLLQPFNFGSTLLLTAQLGMSRGHKGVAKRSKDGRVLSA